MSFTRTAIAVLTIITSAWTAVPSAPPAPLSEGFAGSLPQGAISHRPILQDPATPTESSSQDVLRATTITADNDEQQAMAEWALAQMDAAGLELPPMDVFVHADSDGCITPSGRQLTGYYTKIDGRPTVHSCGTRWTLVHELAHAWDNYQLDDATRERLLEHQGLTDWLSEDWTAAGSEHVASIVAWAIDGSHPTSIGFYDRAHLAQAYEIATGSPKPGTSAPTPTVSAAQQVDGAELPDPEFN